MNKRQVGILWIIALVLAAVASFLLFRSPEDEGGKTKLAAGAPLLKDFSRDDVAKISIKSGDKSATLVRKGDAWSVSESADYPASATSIKDLLIELTDVKVTQGLQCDPAASAPRFGMDPSSSKDEEKGVEAVLSNEAGSEVAHLSFGKNIESASDADPMEGGGGAVGRFVRDHADSSGVYKISTVFPTLSADPKTWLDHKFFTVEKPLAITVSKSGKADETEWKVTRPDEQAEFTLDGAQAGEALDTTLANTLKTLLAYGQFEDVLTADAAAKLADAKGKRTVKIDTAEGFHYTVTVTPVAAAAAAAKEGEPPAATEAVLTVDVTAEIPTERKKEANEAEADAKAKDTAFAERKTALEKKLADEKVFAGRFYKVAQSTVGDVLKDRPALIKAPEAPGTAGAPPQGGIPRLPGSGPGLPQGAMPVQPRQPRRPVEAVTPPIAIPPLEERPPATPKPEEPKPETPKPEEVKPDQPKTEEVKPEMPKTEEVKPEQPKLEEPKLEQPKQPEEPKPEQPKPEEAPPAEQPKEPGQ